MRVNLDWLVGRSVRSSFGSSFSHVNRFVSRSVIPSVIRSFGGSLGHSVDHRLFCWPSGCSTFPHARHIDQIDHDLSVVDVR